ncbi:MAG: SDR family oxidoreductase [Planctomycetaceae bacterium]|nr:SDR family oxidoreductase [Planctomycetaceae bacterium]
MRIRGKIAAITGAGSGIGLAAAGLFAREGATALILEKNGESAEAARKKIVDAGGRAESYDVDVAEWESVRETFDRIGETHGGIDVLYNNASVFWGEKDAAIDILDVGVLDSILRINLFGMMYCSKCAIPLLRRRGGGVIINTASSCGIIGIPNCDAYSASKGAVVTLTKSFAVEYGPEKIRTNCIAPAAILTPMVYESDLNKPTFDEKKFLATGTPLRRWGTPEDIANIALFLASDESSYLNGAIIVADGGITVS